MLKYYIDHMSTTTTTFTMYCMLSQYKNIFFHIPCNKQLAKVMTQYKLFFLCETLLHIYFNRLFFFLYLLPFHFDLIFFSRFFSCLAIFCFLQAFSLMPNSTILHLQLFLSLPILFTLLASYSFSQVTFIRP